MVGTCLSWNRVSLLSILLLCSHSLATILVKHSDTGRVEHFETPTNGVFYFSVEVAKKFGLRRFQMQAGSSAPWQETLHRDSVFLLQETDDDSPAACVDPFWACERTNLPQPRGIAANWYWLKALTGNTHPGASLPHGMVSVVAYSGAYPSGYGVNGASSEGSPASILAGNYTKTTDFASVPYQYSSTGFAHFQPSGTGSIGNYMNYIKVMPLASAPMDFLDAGAPWLERRRSTLIGERAEPGKYAAILGEEDVAAEVTTAPGVALHRYAFQAGQLNRSIAIELSASGLLDRSHAQQCQGLQVRVNGSAVEGVVFTPGPTNNLSAGLKLYFSLHLGADVESFWPPALGRDRIELNASQIASLGGSVGVIAPADSATEVRVGFSLRSLAAARANLDAAASATFDDIADAAWREWNDALSRINIEDDASSPGSLASRNLFYSVLFHALRKPTDFTDHVPDDWVGEGALPGYVFDLGTMWDQYKTTLPLLLSVYPRMGKRLLNGLLNLARRFGEFPTGYTMDEFTSRFDDQARGLAHHTLADGFFRNYSLDWKTAAKLMLRTFESGQGLQFLINGSTPPLPTHTLDLAGAAFATSHVASASGNQTAADLMRSLARNALNVFNRSSCLLKIGPGTQYYEGTYWNYGFRPLTDMASRIALCNDTQNFVDLMDEFFGYGKKPVVQLPILPWQAQHPAWVRERVSNVGYDSHSYEGLCNEPDMETPYSYAYAGRADRTQEVVNGVKTYSYAPGRGGLAGNDDSGGEAAWYVWSSIGIFPIAGQPIYIIGSPSFGSVSVHLASATFRISRRGSGRYIQSGMLNGQSLGGRAWLWVSEVHRGGELVLSMGAKNSEWGSKVPPSFPARNVADSAFI